MQTLSAQDGNNPEGKIQVGRSLPVPHGNIPALDGLRAVAVVGVIVGHVSDTFLPGGFMGVDVFFVLSGFLIASIIHRDLHKNTFSFQKFYYRRIQRLLPNAALTVMVTLIVIWLIDLQWMEILSARHAIWTLLNFSNLFAYKNLGDYWGTAAENSPFTHFWSLGIEEQYYFLFPLVFFLFYKFLCRKSGVMPALIFFFGLAVVSFALGFRQTFRNPIPAFYLPPFRFWELFAGVALALHVKPFIKEQTESAPEKSCMAKILGVAGLAMMPVLYFFYEDAFPFPGWVALLPILASIFVIFSVSTSDGIVSRLLSLRPIVRIGKYSYSLYLWHWPAIILAQHSLPFEDMSVKASLGALAGIVVGISAYHLVERPLRICGDGGGKWRFAATIVLFSFAMGSAFMMRARYYERKAAENFAIQEMKEKLEFDPMYYPAELYTPRNGARPDPVVLEGPRKNVSWYIPEEEHLNDIRLLRFVEPLPRTLFKSVGIEKTFGGRDALRIMLLGNSHAEMYALTVEEMARDRKINVFFNVFAGAILFMEKSKKLKQSAFDDIVAWKPDVLVLVERWDHYKPHFLKAKLFSFIQEIQPHVATVFLITQVPVCKYGEHENLRGNINLLAIKENTNFPRMLQDNKAVIRLKNLAVFEEIPQAFPYCSLLRADRLFTKPDGSVLYAQGRKFYYMDDDHLTTDGAELARPLFEQAIESAIESKKKNEQQKQN